MISENVLMWIGTIAVITLLYGLRTAVPRIRGGEVALEGIISYGISFALWILFTIHSTAYLKNLGGGVQAEITTRSFTIFGLIATVLAFILLFDATIRTLKDYQR